MTRLPKKVKKGPPVKKGLDEWMATYADMVTLLFCFFVMLYAASSTDETKLQYILQAFKTDGKYINTVVGREEDPQPSSSEDGNSDVPVEDEGNQTAYPDGITVSMNIFESLYDELASISEQFDLSESLKLYATPGLIRITLQGDVWFDGDSFTLKPEGQQILSRLYPAIAATSEYILSVQLQGHTADVASAVPGAWGGWQLSGLRAASVLDFLLERGMVEESKFKSEGFSGTRPIGDNSTSEGMAKNRRVEIIINRDPDVPDDIDRYMSDIMFYDYNLAHNEVDALGEKVLSAGHSPESVVNAILGEWADRFKDPTDTEENPFSALTGPSGPGAGSFTDVRDSDYDPITEADIAAAEAAAANAAAAENGNSTAAE